MFFQINETNNDLIQTLMTQEFGENMSCVELGEGTENKNFLINDTLVLRVLYIDKNSILYETARDYIEREITFVNALFDFQINQLSYKRFKNKEYLLESQTDHGIIYFLQYDFIPGSFLTYNKKNIQKLAQMVGECHEASQKLSDIRSILNIPVYDALSSSLHHHTFIFDNTIAQNIANYALYWQIFKDNTQEIKSYRNQHPNILIHCDLHRKNILVTDDMMTVIDFGDTRLSVIPEDIGTCFWGMGIALQKVETFEKGVHDFFSAYPKPLTEEDKAFCLRFALQRFLDIHLFYLKENLSSAPKMKYQTEKFAKEKPIIDYLIATLNLNL